MKYTEYKNLVYQIIGSAMTVHTELNWGLLEPVYQEALSIELSLRNIQNKREEEIKVYYKGYELDKKYKMDIIVGDIIIELKSVVKLEAAHRAQLCNYLRLTKKPIVGERWAYDKNTNECYLVDKDMHRVFDKDYSVLLKSESDKY